MRCDLERLIGDCVLSLVIKSYRHDLMTKISFLVSPSSLHPLIPHHTQPEKNQPLKNDPKKNDVE
jgi:hypothetical protein